jgi:hypothetical protein
LKGVTQVFKLEKRREDVVKLRLKDQPALPETLAYCGFQFSGLRKDELPAGMEFGFIVNGEEMPAARLGIAQSTPGKPSLSRKFLAGVGARLWRRR